ncbi:MAG TPA: NAD+ synthase [Spirochaetota bacterium]|nr:NAD+ synthase [Spirochaetota bacterium]HOH36033.1 NAD+ synthase [Spirochaetota bacterium]HPJ14172.1 NAD+ synthase [Spirochaetota bacterium]HPY03894.1 NAD+ synthase [Spirochaetota bacterium]HQA52958.1 NAD+ synthase [Spirochaetota bacterium]
MKIALAQFNPIVGDISGNKNKIINLIEESGKQNADIIVFPELATIGYPPMDLLENKALIKQNIDSLIEIASKVSDTAVVIGAATTDESGNIFNSALFISHGKIIRTYNKTLLPNYDVFDEERYFTSGNSYLPVEFKGIKIGLTVCEDIWNCEDSEFTGGRKYDIDPVSIYAEKKIDLLINISASPFVTGKIQSRREMVSSIAKKYAIEIVYVNQVGGNDSLVFDGSSFGVNKKGQITSTGKYFEEGITYHLFGSENQIHFNDNLLEEIESALICGLRDYAHKSGFNKALLGLSGGIDSALTAVIAAKALGKENVTGITMPSVFSSQGSVDDSKKLADNLGINFEIIPIKRLHESYIEDLAHVFKNAKPDVTEENLQARIRGNLLMAYSNKFSALLLSTGNKSELSMGYCTLYGDMNGGLAVISDLPKTTVYELSKFINRNGEIIPSDTITKPPSAELRENQTDQDTLPPYDILDSIIECYIEKKMSSAEIIQKGFDKATVEFVLKAIDRNEYKRRQAAPGLKVTGKAFGIGRRYPIVQRYIP